MNRLIILIVGALAIFLATWGGAESEQSTASRPRGRAPAGHCDADGWCQWWEDCETCPQDCGECPCPGPLVYDNGTWLLPGVGCAPAEGWTQAGCIDDFVLPDPDLGGTRFDCAQVAFSVQKHAPEATTWELRIYDLNDVDGQGGGDGTLGGLGDFNLAVPKCFLTYSVEDGSLVVRTVFITDGGTVNLFDGIGLACELEPGHYGFHVMLPGVDDNYYYFWEGVPPDGSECVATWGPAVPFPVDSCASGGPEFEAMHFNMHVVGPCGFCALDADDDGDVGAFDLASLLGGWGACADEHCCPDTNNDGLIDAADLADLLGSWGPCP